MVSKISSSQLVEVVAPSPISTVLFQSAKRVRVLVDGVYVADSSDMLLLREPAHLPVYYFPRDGVRWDMLEERGRGKDRTKGDIILYALNLAPPHPARSTTRCTSLGPCGGSSGVGGFDDQ